MQDFYQASGLADRSGPGADEMKWQPGRDSAVLELRLALPSEERGSYLDATFQVPWGPRQIACHQSYTLQVR